LQEVFDALRKTNMCLNPEKCVFGVEGDKFLGFMLLEMRSHHRDEKPEESEEGATTSRPVDSVV